MTKTEDIRKLMSRIDEAETLSENPLLGIAAGVAGRALAGKAVKTVADKTADILGDDELDESMSDEAIKVEEWATAALKRYNFDERRVEWAFTKAFPKWAGNKGAINFLKGVIHRADKETPKLMGQDWQQDVRDWVDSNIEMFHGDTERMLWSFRKVFKHLKMYDTEGFLHDYINSKDMNESNYPDDFRGIPGEEFDDARIEYAEDVMWEDVDDWLTKREGRDYINYLIGDEMDDEEKEGLIIDDILPEIQVMIEHGVPAQSGYESLDYSISRKQVKDWFDKWCEKNNISIRIEDEAYESMNGMYEDNAEALINSGDWNKAEKNTKYDPPDTDNKGKSARAGFVG